MISMKTAPEGGSVQKTLLDKQKSSLKKYRELFVGDSGIWFLLIYELVIFLFSWVPGALGIMLRKLFYPLILKQVGRGVIFGRNITIRHPQKIRIGSHTLLDDNVVLDAKGSKNEGIYLGENVIVGRNTILSCKEGSIFLEDYTNVSANCMMLSETMIRIGKYSFLAGQCYLVAGGNHSYVKTDIPIMFQPSLDKGGIMVGEDVWMGASVTVLDGVTIGKGSIIGAGAVIKDPLPEYSISVGVPAKVIKNRRNSG
jgi:acetyltransferase-like isoleucine patch superfamily enzyme